MFNDLFHPTKTGALSEWIAGRLFRLYRRWPRLLPTSGPLSIAVVIATWAMLLATGFALIYFASFPAGYDIQSATSPQSSDRWWWSFDYSLEMMTTLGLGDIRPNPTWLKILSVAHTLIGFSFVTASITWIVLLFPALRRMRKLARKAMTLSDAEEQSRVPVVADGMHIVLTGLAEEVIQMRVDLVHFPLLFYFYAEDNRDIIAGFSFPLMRFAKAGNQDGRPDLIRLASAGLRIALQDLADLVGDRLVSDYKTPEAVFRRFGELHTPRK